MRKEPRVEWVKKPRLPTLKELFRWHSKGLRVEGASRMAVCKCLRTVLIACSSRGPNQDKEITGSQFFSQ